MSARRTDPEAPVLEVQDLVVRFPLPPERLFDRTPRAVHAVEGVSFTVGRGETLGLVGESGCGKSTTGRAILRKAPITSGTVTFEGRDITQLKGEKLRRLRRDMQMVFQDPYASLNPRMRVREILAEPFIAHGVTRKASELDDLVAGLLNRVNLPFEVAFRYPHAFSGGQRQRIGIARALALSPKLIVADEPVSALDVSVQASVVNLMRDLQEELGLSYLFIAHNLAVVRHISHRVGIMYCGQLVELAGRDDIYERPLHPYTKALLSAIPVPDPEVAQTRRRIVLQGDVPSPISPPSGCRFHTRCPYRQASRCADEAPALRELRPGHTVACHWAEQILAGEIKAQPVAEARPVAASGVA